MPGYYPQSYYPSINPLTSGQHSHYNDFPPSSFHRSNEEPDTIGFSGAGGNSNTSASHQARRDQGAYPGQQNLDAPFVPPRSESRFGSTPPVALPPDSTRQFDPSLYADFPDSPTGSSRSFGSDHDNHSAGSYDSGSDHVGGYNFPRTSYTSHGRQLGPHWPPSSNHPDTLRMQGMHPHSMPAYASAQANATMLGDSPYSSSSSPSSSAMGLTSRSPSHESLPHGTLNPRALELVETDLPDAGEYLRETLGIAAHLPVNLSVLPQEIPGIRPEPKLATLVKLAIYGSARGRLTLQEIYAAIMQRYQWYRENENSVKWKGSIRHLLSLHSIFRHSPRPITEPGKGNYWTLDVQTDPEGLKRERKRRAKRTGSAEEEEEDGDEDDENESADSGPEMSPRREQGGRAERAGPQRRSSPYGHSSASSSSSYRGPATRSMASGPERGSVPQGYHQSYPQIDPPPSQSRSSQYGQQSFRQPSFGQPSPPNPVFGQQSMGPPSYDTTFYPKIEPDTPSLQFASPGQYMRQGPMSSASGQASMSGQNPRYSTHHRSAPTPRVGGRMGDPTLARSRSVTPMHTMGPHDPQAAPGASQAWITPGHSSPDPRDPRNQGHRGKGRTL